MKRQQSRFDCSLSLDPLVTLQSTPQSSPQSSPDSSPLLGLLYPGSWVIVLSCPSGCMVTMSPWKATLKVSGRWVWLGPICIIGWNFSFLSVLLGTILKSKVKQAGLQINSNKSAEAHTLELQGLKIASPSSPAKCPVLGIPDIIE